MFYKIEIKWNIKFNDKTMIHIMSESDRLNHSLIMRFVREEIDVAVKFQMRNFTREVNDLICDSCGIMHSYCEDFEFPSVLLLNQFYSFCSCNCKWDYISEYRKMRRIANMLLPVGSS